MNTQKLIKWNDQKAKVNSKLADLILNMWKLGIKTTGSGESELLENYQFIKFADSNGAEEFLNIVSQKYSEDTQSLHNRISWERCCKDESGNWARDTRNWHFQCFPRDANVKYDKNNKVITKHSAFSMNIYIEFPDFDIPDVLCLLKNKVKSII